jgi:hypothetical protein
MRDPCATPCQTRLTQGDAALPAPNRGKLPVDGVSLEVYGVSQ